ncbi:MAG: amidohydrolase family protein [Actinobacteria bacterium]|nr:amidohydrolase family protein [Actinomycetota bacterium]
MPYIEGRVVHDADAHIMEPPTWLVDYADPDVRERLAPRDPDDGSGQMIDLDRVAAKHASDEYLAAEAEEIMVRKNFAATGSFLAQDRPRALDLIGVASQLVFNTFHNGRFAALEQGDPDLAYGAARAHNRGMVEFCSVDQRLLPTLYVPLADPARSAAMAHEAVDMGAAALLVPSACPKGHSPSHLALDPVWATAEEAGLPVVFHVGGGGDHFNGDYFRNGLPIPPDFHGGEENFRSVSYMAIPGPPMQTLATMIFDGVLDRFPRLRIGVIEMGAIWMPSWMRQMEAAFEAFVRHEERLQKLELRPSEYVVRQIRATPYPTEDVGWITEQIGPDVCLFSTDYPHVEGGRRPVERFEASLGDASAEVRQRFYCDNFVDLMGSALHARV